MRIILKAIVLLSILAVGYDLPAQLGPNGSASGGVKPEPSANTAPATDDAYVIGSGDVLAVNVWREAEISRAVPVRPDGRISLPLVGELQASGKTPKDVETEIAAKLKSFVADPEVTVIVQEIRSQKISVLGMVMHPGSFPLIKPMTVLDAIANAGGFRDFAKQKDVYVLRRTGEGKTVRLAANCKEAMRGRNAEQNFELQSNDTIIVP